MRALYRRLRAQPMTDNVAIAIAAAALAVALAINFAWGLPQ